MDDSRGDEVTSLKHEAITEGIIIAFYHVYNALGYGFLEKVYDNALCYELRNRGFSIDSQQPLTVWYQGVAVGEYYADIVVNNCVIVEIKCATSLIVAHEAQLLNYLRATNMEVGLLLNFGPKPEFKRKIFSHRNSNPNPVSYPRSSA